MPVRTQSTREYATCVNSPVDSTTHHQPQSQARCSWTGADIRIGCLKPGTPTMRPFGASSNTSLPTSTRILPTHYQLSAESLGCHAQLPKTAFAKPSTNPLIAHDLSSRSPHKLAYEHTKSPKYTKTTYHMTSWASASPSKAREEESDSSRSPITSGTNSWQQHLLTEAGHSRAKSMGTSHHAGYPNSPRKYCPPHGRYTPYATGSLHAPTPLNVIFLPYNVFWGIHQWQQHSDTLLPQKTPYATQSQQQNSHNTSTPSIVGTTCNTRPASTAGDTSGVPRN